MQVVKRVWFDKSGEKELLDKLAKMYTDESSLADAIQKEFMVEFLDAMIIASRWLEVKRKAKTK